ncbi:MAG TPA: hypothetical protein VM842_06695, partial [Nitrospira sp.]|nr:hypothetical protein [Nitrospira sp.]
HDRKTGFDIPGLAGDLLEAMRSIVPLLVDILIASLARWTGYTMTVELDFWDLPFASRHLDDRRGQSRRD